MRYLFFVLASLFLTKLAMAASDPSQFTQDDEAFGSTTGSPAPTGTTAGTTASAAATDGSSGSIVGQIDSSDPNYVPPQAKAAQQTPQAMCEATGKPPAVCVCELQIKFQKEQELCLKAAMDPDVAKLANSVSATNKYASQYGGGSDAKAGSASGTPTSIDDLAMKMATEILGGSSPTPAQTATAATQAGPDANMGMLMNLLMMGSGAPGDSSQGYIDQNGGAAQMDQNSTKTTTDNGASFY